MFGIFRRRRLLENENKRLAECFRSNAEELIEREEENEQLKRKLKRLQQSVGVMDRFSYKIFLALRNLDEPSKVLKEELAFAKKLLEEVNDGEGS